jgi:threonine dehydrogenase-like Zn-dependent dehydrogenase
MTDGALAVVQIGDREYEYKRFPLPEIGPDDGLLKVDRCGICGADVQIFNGDVKENNFGYPTIPGHEPLGTIVELGENAANRWGVELGDRVIIEATVPCGICKFCAGGNTTSCIDRKNLGYTRTSVAPSLWGGFAEYLYMHPRSKVHKVARDVPLDAAATFNALACGIGWAVHDAGTGPGDTVVVLGAGQRGVMSVLAAKDAGAERVIITGLGRDKHKLEAAMKLGADVAVNVEEQDIVEVVRELTGGDLADVVLDLAPDAPGTVVDAIEIARPKGMVLLAGLKGSRSVEGLLTDKIVHKALTVKGAWGKKSAAYTRAIEIMESGRYPLEMLHTRSYSLDQAADAIAALAGQSEEDVVCLSISPNGD